MPLTSHLLMLQLRGRSRGGGTNLHGFNCRWSVCLSPTHLTALATVPTVCFHNQTLYQSRLLCTLYSVHYSYKYLPPLLILPSVAYGDSAHYECQRYHQQWQWLRMFSVLRTVHINNVKGTSNGDDRGGFQYVHCLTIILYTYKFKLPCLPYGTWQHKNLQCFFRLWHAFSSDGNICQSAVNSLEGQTHIFFFNTSNVTFKNPLNISIVNVTDLQLEVVKSHIICLRLAYYQLHCLCRIRRKKRKWLDHLNII